MAKCIVTGGAGFIGSHIVDALLGRGDDVIVIDNLSTSTGEFLSQRAQFVKEDIRDFDSIAPYFKGVDFVFHEAALARVQPSIVNPRETHDVNTTGTLNVLLASRDAGVKRVIYAASSSAYGNQEQLPLVETMQANPISPYALQKYEGELLAKLFSTIYGLETVSLRYFNVYGPRMPDEGGYALAIGIFLKQRKEGKPLTLVPDGNQSRDFTHVRDIVRANLLAAESPNVGKGEVMNIGTGKAASVLQIADIIGGPTIWLPPRIEPKATLADNQRAEKLIGWKPRENFSEGIRELMDLAGIDS